MDSPDLGGSQKHVLGPLPGQKVSYGFRLFQVKFGMCPGDQVSVAFLMPVRGAAQNQPNPGVRQCRFLMSGPILMLTIRYVM